MPKKEKISAQKKEPEVKSLIRLNKYISNAGICNRREADQLIDEGLIKVNGKVVTSFGFKVNKKDTVHYEDEIVYPGEKFYVLLNKPKKFSHKNELDKTNVRSVEYLVRNAFQTDFKSIDPPCDKMLGLLLLTNDFNFIKKVEANHFKLESLYQVQFESTFGDKELAILNKVIEEQHSNSIHKVSLAINIENAIGIEAKQLDANQIVELAESNGFKVKRIDRILMGELSKKGIARGQWRLLDDFEIRQLKKSI